MDFSTSTHRRHWLLSREALRNVQERTVLLAAEACQQGTQPEGSRCFAVGKSDVAKASPRNEPYRGNTSPSGGVNASDGDGERLSKKRGAAGVEPILTVEEEGLIKSQYAKMIQEICGRHSAHQDLRRSDKVQATAVAYFCRFYLSNSVLEHDPKLLILACIFLASKTEEQITNVNLLAKATGVDDLQILAKELPLLQARRSSSRQAVDDARVGGWSNGALESWVACSVCTRLVLLECPSSSFERFACSCMGSTEVSCVRRRVSQLVFRDAKCVCGILLNLLVWRAGAQLPPFGLPPVSAVAGSAGSCSIEGKVVCRRRPARRPTGCLTRRRQGSPGRCTGERMGNPPFNVAVALDQEFRGRKDWRETLRAAEKLVQEMDSLLVEKDKLKAVNKIMKRHALWSERRATGGADGERRKSKKIKSEPA